MSPREHNKYGDFILLVKNVKMIILLTKSLDNCPMVWSYLVGTKILEETQKLKEVTGKVYFIKVLQNQRLDVYAR